MRNRFIPYDQTNPIKRDLRNDTEGLRFSVEKVKHDKKRIRKRQPNSFNK